MNRLKLFFYLWFVTLPNYSQSNNYIEKVLQKGHSRYVTCVYYSPNGKYLVTGSYDNTLILWNAISGKEIRTFTFHTGFIRNVAFSPDGNHILSTSNDNRCLVYDIRNGIIRTEIKIHKNRLFEACFSPDGSKILTMNDRDDVAVWNAQNGELIGEYKKSYSASINSSCFNSNGTKLLTRTSNSSLMLIDLNDSLNNNSFVIDKPFSYAISPDDKLVAIGSSKKHAKIFNLATGKELFHLDGNPEKKCDGCKTLISFSSNGKYLATADKYSGITIWDTKNGKPFKQIDFTDTWLDKISFSPDSKYVLANADDDTYIWELRTGSQILHLNFHGLECLPVFSPDSKQLLTTGQRNTAVSWDLSSGKEFRRYQGFLNKERSDGLKFEEGNWYHSNIIRYLSLKSKVSISPDGNHIVKGNIDSIAIIINTQTGKVVNKLIGHNKVVLCTDYSSNGKYILTGSGDRTIKLWDAQSGELIRTFVGHRELIFDAKFSPDSKYIISGSWDATMRTWDTERGKMVTYVNLDNNSPYQVEFTPKNLYAITGDLSNKLRLWEIDAGEEFREFIGHTNIVADINFSPDNKHMLTSSLDGKVKIWDLLSGMLINKYGKHLSEVYCAIYHPDSNYVISAGNDRAIHIWNPETGELIETLTGHSGGITSLQIAGKSNKLFSCSIDGEIKVWDLNTFQELFTYIRIDRNNWLASLPSGHFDGSENALKHINYVSGLDAVPVGAFFEKFYTPNLIRRINAGEDFDNETGNIIDLLPNAPTLYISLLNDSANYSGAEMDSLDWFKETIAFSVNIIDQGGGIDELRIYNNGKLVENIAYNKSKIRSGKKYTEFIEIPIGAGDNRITAIAYNNERTESEPATLTINYDGIQSDVDLYLISIGIDKYRNPTYQLNYAIEDAKAYSKMIKQNAEIIFNSVNETFIRNADAGKEQIQNAFKEVSAKAGAEDVFIFYFAGHGTVSMDGDSKTFYIIPFDVTNMYGNEAILKEKAISANEILEFSKQIKARKQLFVLDACQSGGVLETFNTRGAEREKAIAQLARSTGTFFLLASGAIQYASEAKDLGHGIFTYAVLEGLGGKADGGVPDEKITANELKSYVEDRVPELTKKYMLTPQYPTGYSFGQDFPVTIVK